ncbi:MAG TPA: protein-disulfide reductase DsbD domain-containing protein [Vicinamibacterales bacterium]
MLRVSVTVLALCAAGAGQALPPKSGGHAAETKHLAVTTSSSPDAVAPGKRVTLAVDVAPKPKMHVYAPGQEGYITITLTLEAAPAFSAAKAKYPAGEKLFMPALKETQLVYAKPFRIAQDLTLAATPELRKRASEGGSLAIKGTLRYQACDEAICYLPVTLPLAWTVKLASGK